MSVQLAGLHGILHPFWSDLQGRAPAALYQKAGPMWKLVRKGMKARNSNVIGGRGVLNFGTSTGLPPVGGSSYSVAMANAGQSSNHEFAVTTVKCWQPLVMNWEVYEFGDETRAAYKSGVLHESQLAVKRWHHANSHHIWQDGSGALGRISTIDNHDATNDRVTFVNKLSARMFEVGDRCVAAAARSTGGLKSATVAVVTKVNRGKGQVTFDTNLVATLSWAALDYVYHDQWRNSSIVGHLGWCPNADPTSTAFFGVARDEYPDRLGGNRRAITSGDDPYSNLVEVMRIAREADADINCIFIPSHEMATLQTSLRDRNTGSPYGKKPPTGLHVCNFETLMISDSNDSSKSMYVYSDPYQIDIDRAEETDSTYFGFNMADTGIYTGKTGIGWKGYGAPEKNIDQTNEQTNSFYGAYMQFVQAAPNNQVRVAVGVS